jgi:hypothetical protein
MPTAWTISSGCDGRTGSCARTAAHRAGGAWAMLRRFGSVLIRPGRERLSGIVEVDETFIGGEEPGLRGGRAKGKKSLVAVAVEFHEPKGYGRCRMTIIPDASAPSLQSMIADHVEAGSQVITDRWQGYRKIDKLGDVHDRRSQRAAKARGDDPADLPPGVHRIASLAKRSLLGTHQGSVDEAHPPSLERSPATRPWRAA